MTGDTPKCATALSQITAPQASVTIAAVGVGLSAKPKRVSVKQGIAPITIEMRPSVPSTSISRLVDSTVTPVVALSMLRLVDLSGAEAGGDRGATDSHATFDGVEAGEYVLVLTRAGLPPLKRHVMVEAGRSAKVSMVME